MDQIRRSLLLSLLSLTLLLASENVHARAKPVYNIVDKSIATNASAPLTMKQVGMALASAARAKRWTVVEVEPGFLQAEINVRKHFAAIDIRYTIDSYSITYRDSRVLKYDGTKIHRNYNKWIKHIEQIADENLATL